MFISSEDLDKGVCSVVQTETWATTYFFWGAVQSCRRLIWSGRQRKFKGFSKQSFFAEKNFIQEGQINQYKYKIFFNVPNMPSFYAFNPNHSALQPITYNTNTSWFAPIVRLFVSFLSAASNNIRSIDYQISTRAHSTPPNQSIMSAKGERRFLLVPFGKIVKLLFIAGRVSFSFHHSLYQYGNVLYAEWTAGTRLFFFKNADSEFSQKSQVTFA